MQIESKWDEHCEVELDASVAEATVEVLEALEDRGLQGRRMSVRVTDKGSAAGAGHVVVRMPQLGNVKATVVGNVDLPNTVEGDVSVHSLDGDVYVKSVRCVCRVGASVCAGSSHTWSGVTDAAAKPSLLKRRKERFASRHLRKAPSR